METVLICAGALAWWLVGVAGFVYWWTTEHDLETDDILFTLFIGIFGPVAFLGGAITFAGRRTPRTLVRKRQQ